MLTYAIAPKLALRVQNRRGQLGVCAKTRSAESGFFIRLTRRRQNDGPVSDSAPIRIPITGELDLHTFRPADIPSLLDDYFAECRKRRILQVRVVHGKGTGTLRTTVHAHLRRSSMVSGFRTADETGGGWGATWVTLKPHDS